jgi:hypothetical protein
MIPVFSDDAFRMLVLCFAAITICGTSVQAADNKNAPTAAKRPAGHGAKAAAVAPNSRSGTHGAAHAGTAHVNASRHTVARAHHEFHEHDVHRFNRTELARWRGGRWNETCYDGRCGWWWFSSGQWYFYDRPVYPYPIVVSDIGYVEPVVVVPGPTRAAQAPLPVTAAPQFWYYCDDPPGYYPKVANCNTQFREMSTPPRH